MLINLMIVIIMIFLFVIILYSWHLSNKVLHPKRVCLDKSIDIIEKYGLRVPTLFIHGDKDSFTPCSMTKEMYEARIKSVEKNICTMKYIAKDSDYTESYWNNKEEYDRVVGEFLRNI